MIKQKRRPKSITKADEAAQKAENLIQQDFTAEKANEKWLTDITEVPCSNAKLYLAPVFDCYDNARMESFFATLKKETLYKMDTTKMTTDEVKSVIYRYIQYYNLRRIYTTNGGLPPMEKRRRYFAKTIAA